MLWEEKARQDKARFQVEKLHYTGPWKVPRKKRMNSDIRIPKRPMSAFLAFSHANRAEEKKKHPNLTNNEITRMLAKQWKNAQDDEKKKYIEQESALRKKYLLSIALWRHSQKNELLSQRQKREEMALKEVADREREATAESIEYCNTNYDPSVDDHYSSARKPLWSSYKSQFTDDVSSSSNGSHNVVYEAKSLATTYNSSSPWEGYEEYSKYHSYYPTPYSVSYGATFHEEISHNNPLEEGSSEYYYGVRVCRGKSSNGDK
jgi:HMG (high mobility group) box